MCATSTGPCCNGHNATRGRLGAAITLGAIPSDASRSGSPDGLAASVTSRTLFGFFVVSLIASICTDARSSDGVLYQLGLGVSLLTAISTFVVPRRYIVVPLLVCIVCSSDLTQADPDIAQHGLLASATLWQVSIAGLPPAMTVFGLLVVAMARFAPPRPILLPHQRWLMVWLFVVAPVVSVAFGYASNVAEFVTDAKLAMFFGLGILFFRMYFTRFPDELANMLAIALAMMAGRFVIDFAYLVFGIVRTEISGVNRVSVDSAKGLLVVLMVYLLYRVTFGRRRRAAVLLPFALMLLIAYATRWLMLTLILGVLLFGLLAGPRRAIRIGLTSVLLVAAGLTVASWIRPATLDIAQKRLSSLATIQSDGIQAVDATRVISIVNSTRLLWDRRSLLIGMGYGSWYGDDYLPYPPGYDLVGGFDEESIANHQYYRIHDFTFHLLFKLGLIGLGLYIGVFLVPLVRLWHRRVAIRHSAFWEPSIVLWAAMPTVLTSMFWTGKGLLVSALFVALADQVARAAPAPTQPTHVSP